MGFLPQLWPILNTINIILLPDNTNNTQERKSDNNKDLNSYKWYHELINRHLRLSTYIFVACIAYIFTFPKNIENFDIFYWSPIIIIRDLIITYFFYGLWHWLLYESSHSNKIKHKKFNPTFPDKSQWNHDKFWTTSGTLISSLFEILLLQFMKLNNINFYYKFWDYNYLFISIFFMFIIPYWRDFHFYWIHRIMHPWFTNINTLIKKDKKNPKNKKNKKINNFENYDPGRILYKYIHSLHHKSYNTGPWSGLSMHPIEHLFYYSCILLPLFLTYYFGILQHPLHFLFNKFHATISPLPGHDGFDDPGGGSYFHYLHHSHFQCNYGTPMVPFDKLFGTFEDGSKFRKIKKYDSAKELLQQG